LAIVSATLDGSQTPHVSAQSPATYCGRVIRKSQLSVTEGGRQPNNSKFPRQLLDPYTFSHLSTSSSQNATSVNTPLVGTTYLQSFLRLSMRPCSRSINGTQRGQSNSTNANSQAVSNSVQNSPASGAYDFRMAGCTHEREPRAKNKLAGRASRPLDKKTRHQKTT